MLQTPSQTVGPYFAYGLSPQQYNYDFRSFKDNKLSDPDTDPNTISLSGHVLDGENVPIPDALVEVWLSDGKQQLFGRFGTGTTPDNTFIFYLPKPQSLDGNAPYITLIVFMRGQLIHSYTRVYFPEDGALQRTDEVLNSIPHERRETLIAQKSNEGSYHFDIHMQGEQETVFFEILTKG